MHWNCPHCRTGLEASNDQITGSWGFSLCPTCKRFGLVRAGIPSAVKVDRAPAGEKFIRPILTDSTKPIVRPARPRSQPVSIAATARPNTPIHPVLQEATAIAQTAVKPVSESIKIPEPLPAVPEKRVSFFPKLVMVGCLGLLIWNGYRYLQITQPASGKMHQELVDHVESRAMAPLRIDVMSQVQARTKDMRVRIGPGLQYPVIGVLAPARNYTVVSASAPWYEVRTGSPSPAWVLEDEIRPVR